MSRCLFIAALFLSSLVVQAQKGEFSASVNKNPVSVNDRFKLTLTLTNERGNISMPDFGGLQLIHGPTTSSNYSYRNGVSSSQTSHTYMLVAPKEGTYTIGSAQAHIKGALLKSEPIQIKAVKGASVTVQQKSSSSPGKNNDLFVNIILSSSKVYRGEQVIATYKLYSRYDAVELSSFDMPVLNGFWSEEVETKNSGWEAKLETINGLRYKVAILKKQVLFPQRSGELKIDPMELECVVNRTFFNRGTKLNIRSNEAKLNVMDLPAGKPNGFTGAVGTLKMNVSADKTELKANDAVNLTIKISGQSNLKLITPPTLEFPQDLEVYDPKIEDRISVSGAGMSGSRTFEYLIIPRHAGEHHIEAFSISYFNTRTGKYVELASQPITLIVSKGDGSSSAATFNRVTKEEVKLLEEDIRYIKTNVPELRKADHDLFASPLYIGGMLTPALAFLLFLFVRNKRSEMYADQVGMRTKMADKVARKKLRAAVKALKNNDRLGVFAKVESALLEFLGDKLTIAIVERTREKIQDELNARMVSPELAARTDAALTACEMARYAPESDNDAAKMYEEAVQLIKELNGALKS